MGRLLFMSTILVMLVGLASYTVIFKPEGSSFAPTSKRAYGHGGDFRN